MAKEVRISTSALGRRPTLADPLALAGATMLGFFAVFYTLGYPIY